MDKAISDWNNPVYSAIKAHTNSRPVSFHMPGHKLGRGIISPYPPGIAFVCPGESIRRETIASLREIIQAGGVVRLLYGI